MEGNIAEARGLISRRLQIHPEERYKAINDSELADIRDFISDLEDSSE